MNAYDGGAVTQLTFNNAHDSDPSWSPDGSKIAFESNRDGNYEIYVMNSDGSGQTRLTNTNNTSGDREPDWSPDGTKLIFITTRDDPSSENFLPPGNSIYTINAVDGTGQEALTSLARWPGWGVQPQSPPTQSILTVKAVSQDDEILHVYAKILSADGTVLQRGFTPMNFTGSRGTEYTVTVADYLAREFDHWEDGSTDRVRGITISEGTTMTAYYKTG